MKQLNAYADDAVSEVLTRLRVHSTVYCLAELRSPWGFRVEGRDVAKFHLLLEGDVWLAVDAHDPLLLSAGELVILPYGHKHALKDEPDSRVEALDRILLDHPLDARARLYYGGAGALSRMLCGGFGLNDPVRGLLPDVMRIDAKSGRVGSWTETTFQFLRAEAAQSLPGAKAVFAKIADVFLAQAMREFLTSPSEASSTTALTDPHIAQAVQLLQAEPRTGLVRGTTRLSSGHVPIRIQRPVPRSGRRATHAISDPGAAYSSRPLPRNERPHCRRHRQAMRL
jgi:mannose-6-phosphate isomerase-like protein (cupin superfamily)